MLVFVCMYITIHCLITHESTYACSVCISCVLISLVVLWLLESLDHSYDLSESLEQVSEMHGTQPGCDSHEENILLASQHTTSHGGIVTHT